MSLNLGFQRFSLCQNSALNPFPVSPHLTLLAVGQSCPASRFVLLAGWDRLGARQSYCSVSRLDIYNVAQQSKRLVLNQPPVVTPHSQPEKQYLDLIYQHST